MSAMDRHWMARALYLARQGRRTTTPNPSVGCVLVKNDQVAGEGYHLRAGEPHAEIHALRQAGPLAAGATAYVTLEPCAHHGRTPPCAQALIDAGVSRVVAAMTDPNPRVSGRGLAMLRSAGIRTESGLLESQARALNTGFIQRMQTGRPRLIVKLAMSLDGRTAMSSGESQWITGAAARQDVQRFRARACAILTGAGTVLADNPRLTVRPDPRGPELSELRQPVRVVVDSQARVTPEHRLFTEPGKTWLVRTPQARGAPDFPAYPGDTEILALPASEQRVDLKALLAELGQREINQIWTEAGPGLAGALLAEQLVDELVVYLAPKIMGDQARGLFSLPGVESMADAIDLQLTDMRQIGPDLRLTYLPDYRPVAVSEQVKHRHTGENRQ